MPSPDKAAALIARLFLDEPTARENQEEDLRAEAALLDALTPQAAVFDVEANRTNSSEYDRAAKRVTVSRTEAPLVELFCSTLAAGQVKRLRLAIGWTDLFVIDDGDLIDAKRSAAHRYVRETLGQLLDYGALRCLGRCND